MLWILARSPLKRFLSILLNEYCLIMAGFAIQMRAAIETTPMLAPYKALAPSGFWPYLFGGCALLGYYCLYNARFCDRPEIWTRYAFCLAAPIFVLNAVVIYVSGIHGDDITYGVLALSIYAKAFGLYESENIHYVSRQPIQGEKPLCK